MRTFAILLLSASVHAQETTRVSVDSAGFEGNGESYVASISANARVIAFRSNASNLVIGDTNAVFDIFTHDRVTAVTERISVDSSGSEGNDHSFIAAISGDGRFVVFDSLASNLVLGDGNGAVDIFVHDRLTGGTERVSVSSAGIEADAGSFTPAISFDGRFVAFESKASNLVPVDTNGVSDIFVHDRSTGSTERVSVSSFGVEAGSHSWAPAISADGGCVSFVSSAPNLVGVDTNSQWDIFVHERSTGITERVSVDSSGNEGNDDSYWSALSSDGRLVVFDSGSSNLVAGDTNLRWDVFIHDRATGVTELVSVNDFGSGSNGDSFQPAISTDGRYVSFFSAATNFVPGDGNAAFDVFLRDRSARLTQLISVDLSGSYADGQSISSSTALSGDGQFVAFDSIATDLVLGDTNSFSDIFVRERCVASWSNYGSGFPGTNGVPSLTARQDPILGGTITLDLSNSLGAATTGLLFLGFERTQIRTRWGGQLLVVPVFASLLHLPASGASVTGGLPNSPDLCGFKINMQAIELDTGAARDVSFTQGLELVLGF